MSKKRDARRDAAQMHITRMEQLFRKENMDSVATAQRYKDGQMDGFEYFEPRFNDTEVTVKATDSVSALMDEKEKRAVLDFASYHNPGGGYENGAWAQEEALCSESNLYNVLNEMRDSYYRSHKNTHNSGLYTSDALYLNDIMFAHNGRILPAGVITVAAPNAGVARGNNIAEDEIMDALLKRINTVMNIAAANEVDNLVLGAYGCGVFKNDPNEVAKMFKEWIDEHKGVFKRVVFAIPSGGANYDAFNEVLG